MPSNELDNFIQQRERPIVLVGMMGCGKTYIGQILATKLNAQFIDTDDLIEKEEGTIISDIFTNKGESYFRRCEALAFERAMQDRTAVIFYRWWFAYDP